MQAIDEQQVLQNLAYQAWLERGQPNGSPEVDWDRARQLLQLYRPDINEQAGTESPGTEGASKTGKKPRVRARNAA